MNLNPFKKKIVLPDVKSIRVTKWLPSPHLCQIYNSGLEFAFMSNDKRQATYFVTCKDFLQDALYAQLHETSSSIYGFTYNAKTMPPISLDKTRIILVNKSDPKFMQKAENVKDFINQFCKRLKMKRTNIFQISNPPSKYSNGALYLSGSAIWQNSPPLISLYSLLLRVGFSHTKGQDCMDTINAIINGKINAYCSNDKSYLTTSKKGIDRILKLGYRKFFFIDSHKNYPLGTPIGTMHNSSGINAFANGYTKKLAPYWTRKSLIEIEEITK
jgi:hypothetical protein